jgi:RNA polymerase sigma-70 factor (ECF subfamily)
MQSCKAGVAKMIDKTAVPEATARSRAGVDSGFKSRITRPAVDRNSRIARNVREWMTLPDGNGFEDVSSTMTAADVESRPSAWDERLATFAQVAEQSRAQLLWLARRMTRDRDEAEDIVQEALLRACKSLPRFRGESQMSTWLSVIVKNAGREWLRGRKGRVYLSLEYVCIPGDDPIAREFPDKGIDPEQRCMNKEMNDILLSEIEILNSVCKNTIKMCAIEEGSHREAANALGVSVAVVKSRMFRGKKILKRVVRMRTASETISFDKLSDCSGVPPAPPQVVCRLLPSPGAHRE